MWHDVILDKIVADTNTSLFLFQCTEMFSIFTVATQMLFIFNFQKDYCPLPSRWRCSVALWRRKRTRDRRDTNIYFTTIKEHLMGMTKKVQTEEVVYCASEINSCIKRLRQWRPKTYTQFVWNKVYEWPNDEGGSSLTITWPADTRPHEHLRRFHCM